MIQRYQFKPSMEIEKKGRPFSIKSIIGEARP